MFEVGKSDPTFFFFFFNSELSLYKFIDLGWVKKNTQIKQEVYVTTDLTFK